MDRLKILVCIMILINLIFADETKSDSSALNLLRRGKLFYSISENWIPPSLPSETSCWGCCLLPSVGRLIVHETFRKEGKSESLKVTPKSKFSTGISYSLGVSYTGPYLRSAKGEDLFQNPSWWTYWNNILEIETKYYFNSHWEFKFSGGYMWAHLRNTVFDFYSPEPSNYPWMPVGEDKWDIYSGLGSVGFENKSHGKSTDRLLGAGLEYYFSKGVANDSMGRYDPKTGTSEYLYVNGETFNKGTGCYFLIGFEKTIMPPFKWNAIFILRYGLARSYKRNVAQENIFWMDTVDFNFSGIYLKIGIDYFLRKGGQND